MNDILTANDPGICRKYHYNFERQAPRLYQEQKYDSLLQIIDYIKTECGPAHNLELAHLLLLLEQDGYSDSLIGSATIPEMLQYRAEKEWMTRWSDMNLFYGFGGSIDNTHDRFLDMTSGMARAIAKDSTQKPAAMAIGTFYSGEFDTAFAMVQSGALDGSRLQRQYYSFVDLAKRKFPERVHMAFSSGSWHPQGANKPLGNHPALGFQIGSESPKWRIDGSLVYRFLSAKNTFIVDSLGSLVMTDKFNSWLFGIDAGYKFIDTKRFSSDVFVGLGYDVIFSVTEDGDPKNSVSHGSLGASVGLRQRIFLDQRAGWYVGGSVRYSVVDYGNPRGTDLSGNTLTVSLLTGWSFHETLKQFFRKLNYKGDWRN